MLTQLTPEALQPAAYPRTYGVSLGWKLLVVAIGVLLGIGGIAGVVFLVLSLPHDSSEVIGTTVVSGAILAGLAGLAGLGAYAAISALMYRVVLTEDGIELKEPFRSRRLSCAEIVGRRLLRTQQGPRTLVLMPRDPAVKKLKISLILKTDEMFDAWLARLPDLDQQEVDRSAHELAEALYQNLMPQERQARIRRLKPLAKWVNWTAIALAFGSLILPDHHHVLMSIVIAVPWIAIWLVARFQPLFRFGGKRNDAHPDLTVTLMIPGLLLMARALTDAHTFAWQGPLMLAVAGGLPVCGAALYVDPSLRRQRLAAILIGVFTLAYGLGAGLQIDILADSAKPSVHATQVLGKRVHHGSKSTTYYLTVAPWGPITRNDEISVSAARYGATRMGDTVCVYAGRGAFRVGWYQLRDCPDPKG